MKEIQLTQGKVAIVDDCDYEWLSQWKWQYTSIGYARRNTPRPNRKCIMMHRAILERALGYADFQDTDHINNIRLDNRRCNLRPASRSLNQANRRNCRNTSGYHGVHKTPWGTWVARVQFKGKRYHLGTFNTPEAAAKVYNEAARKYHGEFAVLNKE